METVPYFLHNSKLIYVICICISTSYEVWWWKSTLFRLPYRILIWTKSYYKVGVRDKSTKREHSLSNFILPNTDKLGLQTVIFAKKLTMHFIKIVNYKMLFYTNLFLPYSQKLIQIFLLQCCFLVRFLSVTIFLTKKTAMHQWIT